MRVQSKKKKFFIVKQKLFSSYQNHNVYNSVANIHADNSV